jgi:nucleoside-diphosphate kinase
MSQSKQHHKDEQSLVIIKPDGVQRSLIGEVIQRYERLGLKLVAMKMLVPTVHMVEKHYTIEPGWKKNAGEKSINNFIAKGLTPPSNDPLEVGEAILGRLKKYMTAGPVVAMVWQGAHACAVIRKITGSTEPLSSDVGTIRGDFMLDSYELSGLDDRSIRNIVHASGNAAEAANEIPLWFEKSEIIRYRLVQEKMLYDVNLDGLLE